ncbi:GNAT family N-acetyltransferase [Sphingomonas flavalba]|uniref:GNAT family N-acetyltransferase n=1 Tax=Sphingomonas flavalba TaxID=2559804 RepID=UPI0039E10468
MTYLSKRHDGALPSAGFDVVEARLREVDGAEWDGFAAACSAPYCAAYASLRAVRAKHVLRERLRLIRVYRWRNGVRVQIGQCAIRWAGMEGRFVGGLQLLPSESADWSAAMAAILAHAGAGHYRYGGSWNPEEDRSPVLGTMVGVTVDHVRPLTVQGVDFSRWPSWDAYWRATSTNIQRNARYAEERIEGLAIENFEARGALIQMRRMTRLRARTYRRKALYLNSVIWAFSQMIDIAFYRRMVAISFSRAGRSDLACQFNVHFGGSTYYLFGGSDAAASGASWYLMRDVLHRAYQRNPNGRFVMGPVDYALHDEAVGGGLLRSRRSCRVSDWQTAVVDFHYAPPTVSDRLPPMPLVPQQVPVGEEGIAA